MSVSVTVVTVRDVGRILGDGRGVSGLVGSNLGLVKLLLCLVSQMRRVLSMLGSLESIVLSLNVMEPFRTLDLLYLMGSVAAIVLGCVSGRLGLFGFMSQMGGIVLGSVDGCLGRVGL